MKSKQEKYDALIVEDEKDLCFLLSLILRQKGINPLCINTIREAKVCIKRESPDILFLDNHLTDGSGIDFILEMKKHNPQTKIVMITAHNSAMDREKALINGADYFISKPFNMETIINILNSLYLPKTG